MKTFRKILLFSSLFLFWESSVVAQPTPIGDDFQVTTNPGIRQSSPRAAASSSGDFVVAWSSTITGVSGVVARFFDASGAPLGDELLVPPVVGEVMGSPDVAMGASNEALIIWLALDAPFVTRVDLFGQRFTSDGSPVGEKFQIDEPENSSLALRGGRVAMSESGRFAVVWKDTTDPSNPETADIFGRLFDASGNPLTGEFLVSETSAGIQLSASVAMAPAGNFVVAWQELSDTVDSDIGGPIDFYARLFDASGNATSGDLLIGSVPLGFTEPPFELPVEVAMDPEGNLTFAWSGGSTGIEDFDVWGRRFDPNGNPLSDSFLVSSIQAGIQFSPTLDFDHRGNLLVAWTELMTGLGDQDGGIGLRQFTPAGDSLGEEIQVNTSLPNFQLIPSLASRGDGRFLVAWQEIGSSGELDLISARVFEAGEGPDSALVGHWPLDEGSGDSAINAAGNGLDGTLEQGTGWSTGQQGSAVSFDGVDDLIRIADGGATQLDVTDALTIGLWVRPDGLDGSMQVLVSKDNAYELEIGKLGARSWNLRLNNETVREAQTLLWEEVWQHLAMTWDGTEVCSYFNGLRDGCTPFTGTLVPNDRDLGLGARPSGILEGGPVFHFEGALDEIYIYNRAFSENEVAALVLADLDDLQPPLRMNLQPALSLPAGTTGTTLSVETDEEAECRWDVVAGRRFDAMANAFTTTGGNQHGVDVPLSNGTFRYYVSCRDELGNTNGEDATIVFGVGDSDLCGDLISHWNLEEGSGCTVADTFGPNAGDLGPNCPASAPDWVAGRDGVSRALGFDGGIDQVEVPTPSGFSSLSGLTVAAWVRHDPSGKWRSIVDHREGNADGYDLFLTEESRLFLRVNELTLTGNTVVADGQWHHVVGTYDGVELRLYVDGELDRAQPASSTTIDVAGSLFLGRRWNNDQNPLAGELDEVTVFGRGLSAVEVLDLFGGGIAACIP